MDVRRTYDLHQRMRELGVDDPAGWAESELTEDIPQEARWLVIRRIRAVVDVLVEEPRSIAEVGRLLDSGADATVVRAAVQAVAREVAFSTAWIIDEGSDPEAPEDAPGWSLMETRVDHRGVPVLTRREVGGIHEEPRPCDATAE